MSFDHNTLHAFIVSVKHQYAMHGNWAKQKYVQMHKICGGFLKVRALIFISVATILSYLTNTLCFQYGMCIKCDDLCFAFYLFAIIAA